MLPSLGDVRVPSATGITLSRSAGIVDFLQPDARCEGTRFAGMTPMQILVDTYTVEGVWNLGRYLPGDDTPNRTHLDPAPPESLCFDPDWLSEGTDEFDAPTLPVPLRLTVVSEPGSQVAIAADSSLPFDTPGYTINLIARYFQTGGTELVDDLCLATGTCEWHRQSVGE